MFDGERHGRWGRSGVVALIATFLVVSCGQDEGPVANDAPQLIVDEEVRVEGVVTENTIDPCRIPDPAEPCVEGLPEHLIIDVDGHEVRVHYGGGEWPPCDNVAGLRQGEQTRVGDRVRVFAVAADGGAAGPQLDTCPSPDYAIEPIE